MGKGHSEKMRELLWRINEWDEWGTPVVHVDLRSVQVMGGH